MAETETEFLAKVTENITENVNATAKIRSTPEGMALAYGSLVIMAILPIFFGSYRSVRHHKEQEVSFRLSHCIFQHLFQNVSE